MSLFSCTGNVCVYVFLGPVQLSFKWDMSVCLCTLSLSFSLSHRCKRFYFDLQTLDLYSTAANIHTHTHTHTLAHVHWSDQDGMPPIVPLYVACDTWLNATSIVKPTCIASFLDEPLNWISFLYWRLKTMWHNQHIKHCANYDWQVFIPMGNVNENTTHKHDQ